MAASYIIINIIACLILSDENLIGNEVASDGFTFRIHRLLNKSASRTVAVHVKSVLIDDSKIRPASGTKQSSKWRYQKHKMLNEIEIRIVLVAWVILPCFASHQMLRVRTMTSIW